MTVAERMRRCVCAGCKWNRETLRLLRKNKKGGHRMRDLKYVRQLFRERANPAPCVGVRTSLWVGRIKAAALRLARKSGKR